MPTAEGYYDFVNNRYVYNYTDHLGNVRLSYTNPPNGEIEILEETNYYPFGMRHEGYNNLSLTPKYQYKYNGKELQETGMYDYGARFYLPDIGRWFNVDPLAESTLDPYGYVWNNPIRFIDPTGMEAESTQEPPIKGIDFFKDKTGEYFWNREKDAYEFYSKDKEGRNIFSGYYSPDDRKGPVGNYTIIHNGRDSELAIKDIVKETFYTDVSVEDFNNKIQLQYSSRDIKSSNIFIRDKGSKDYIELKRTTDIEKSSQSYISGLSVKIDEYEETRKYGTNPRYKKMEKPKYTSWQDFIKFIPEIINILKK